VSTLSRAACGSCAAEVATPRGHRDPLHDRLSGYLVAGLGRAGHQQTGLLRRSSTCSLRRWAGTSGKRAVGCAGSPGCTGRTWRHQGPCWPSARCTPPVGNGTSSTQREGRHKTCTGAEWVHPQGSTNAQAHVWQHAELHKAQPRTAVQKGMWLAPLAVRDAFTCHAMNTTKRMQYILQNTRCGGNRAAQGHAFTGVK
jgi:hypothetical protein